MNIFNSLAEFLSELSTNLTLDNLLFGSFILLFLVMVLGFVRTMFTYEVKLLRNVSALNKYFYKNPYINESNIMELNNRMKMVPKTLRYNWQEYMLNRDKAPSEYMNTSNCVEQPIKTSSYANTTTTVLIFTSVIAILALLLSLGAYESYATIGLHSFLFLVLVLPILVAAIGFLFVTFLKARYSTIVSDLYFSFHEFERNMNKACTTMPPFIDYEVLFTQKEIKEGIPVLQDYLEKKALQEKKENEEREFKAMEFEYYDFDELGVENALLLERAMRESEKYIGVRNDLKTKTKNKETEMYNYQKNFDEVTKDYERKAQAARESLTQLTDQINQTTIKIEANYMKKRFNEEQVKLQQLEKDYELASSRFIKQQDDMQSEIDALKAKIEKRRLATEEAMQAECKTYANKIYGQITKTVQDQSKPFIEQIAEDKKSLEKSIEELKVSLEEKQEELVKQETELNKAQENLNAKIAEIAAVKDLKTYFTSPEFKQSFLTQKEIIELGDGRKVNVSEDVVKQIADLEEKLKLAEENTVLYQDKITFLESSLQNKSKELEKNKKQAETSSKDEQGKKEQSEIAEKLSTVKAEDIGLNIGEEPKPKPRKKKLDSLMTAVSKMESKKKKED